MEDLESLGQWHVGQPGRQTDVQIYLSEVLFKVTELQALLQFQMVFTPELFEGILCLIQLSKEPETHDVITQHCTTAWI